MSGPAGRVLLEVKGVSKRFGATRALTGVNLSVHSGEVLAVVGHNGSGKSTLVKVLAKFHHADEGEVLLRQAGSRPVTMRFIHQDLGLVGNLSTVENLSLVKDRRSRWWHRLRHRAEARYAEASVARFGASFDVERPVMGLSTAERTIVAIARALDGWSQDEDVVLVLDEPTAALHGAEAGALMSAVRRVAEQGAGVLFISHRLDEVLGLADTVAALRNGRVVASGACPDFAYDDLVELIAGTTVEEHVNSSAASDRVAFRVGGLAGGSIRRVDLTVREGEIVGIAGQMGSGRDEICSLLFRARPSSGGTMLLDGKELRSSRIGDSIRAGIAYVPGDRRRFGAVMEMTAAENLMSVLDPTTRARWSRVDAKSERREVSQWFERCDVQPRNPSLLLAKFSGGNQQKVVMAKWLRRAPRLLLLDDPTQGVDVGAKAAIHREIAEAAGAGAAVLVASSEERELASLCHRVLVLADGMVVAELQGEDLTEAKVLRAALSPVSNPADRSVPA
jgi:ribose transport system ATP-binding protein